MLVYVGIASMVRLRRCRSTTVQSSLLTRQIVSDITFRLDACRLMHSNRLSLSMGFSRRLTNHHMAQIDTKPPFRQVLLGACQAWSLSIRLDRQFSLISITPMYRVLLSSASLRDGSLSQQLKLREFPDDNPTANLQWNTSDDEESPYIYRTSTRISFG